MSLTIQCSSNTRIVPYAWNLCPKLFMHEFPSMFLVCATRAFHLYTTRLYLCMLTVTQALHIHSHNCVFTYLHSPFLLFPISQAFHRHPTCLPVPPSPRRPFPSPARFTQSESRGFLGQGKKWRAGHDSHDWQAHDCIQRERRTAESQRLSDWRHMRGRSRTGMEKESREREGILPSMFGMLCCVCRVWSHLCVCARVYETQHVDLLGCLTLHYVPDTHILAFIRHTFSLSLLFSIF